METSRKRCWRIETEISASRTRTAQAYMRLAAHRRAGSYYARPQKACQARMRRNGVNRQMRNGCVFGCRLDLTPPDKFVSVLGKRTHRQLERDRQAKYERDLEPEMSRGALYAAPCIERARHAHTRPFECSQSYNPDKEEAQKEPAGDRSLEALRGDLRAALVNVSRIVSGITSKCSEMPEEQ